MNSKSARNASNLFHMKSVELQSTKVCVKHTVTIDEEWFGLYRQPERDIGLKISSLVIGSSRFEGPSATVIYLQKIKQ